MEKRHEESWLSYGLTKEVRIGDRDRKDLRTMGNQRLRKQKQGTKKRYKDDDQYDELSESKRT